jgi:hypothetical protein
MFEKTLKTSMKLTEFEFNKVEFRSSWIDPIDKFNKQVYLGQPT